MTGEQEVWSVVEAPGGRPHETAVKLASEARRLGRLLGALPCCVVTDRLDDPAAVLGLLAQHGASKVYLAVGDGDDASAAAEAVTTRLAALVGERRPEAVLFAASRDGAEWGARLAARLRTGLVARCVEFELNGEALAARRQLSGGRAHATVGWALGPPYLATVDLVSLEAIAGGPADASLEVVEVAAPPAAATRTTHRRRWRLSARELDLTEAAFVIGVGRPVDTAESLERVQGLADRLGATLGGSRIAHFQGIVPKSRQIGASGKWISPEVYLTFGVSGASYHVMGIKGAKHVIAVNTDRDAPIFKLAEVGIVADLEAVVGALLAAVADGPATGEAAAAAP